MISCIYVYSFEMCVLLTKQLFHKTCINKSKSIATLLHETKQLQFQLLYFMAQHNPTIYMVYEITGTKTITIFKTIEKVSHFISI